MANGYFPPGQGGNDPVRQAAIQQLSRVPVSRPDVQSQAPIPPQAAGGPVTGPMMQNLGAQGPVAGQGAIPGGSQQLGNEVAFHLSNAFNALVKTGPSSENLSAIKQFIYSVAELASPQAAQGGQAAGMGQPAPAQAPMQAPPQGAPMMQPLQ